MPDVQKIKQNAVRSLVHARAADMVDRLADQAQEKVPADRTFTRDELVALLRDASERWREEV